MLGEGATTGAIFEEKEVVNMTPRQYNLIGCDPILQDSRDPLGANIKSSSEHKANIDKLKFYQESRCDIDFVILTLHKRLLMDLRPELVLLRETLLLCTKECSTSSIITLLNLYFKDMHSMPHRP